jgi:hypothetical protein
MTNAAASEHKQTTAAPISSGFPAWGRGMTRVPTATVAGFAALHESAYGRFCCKSLFALVIKIPFGCTRDFRVNMRGTSLPADKLAGDLDDYLSILDRHLQPGAFVVGNEPTVADISMMAYLALSQRRNRIFL